MSVSQLMAILRTIRRPVNVQSDSTALSEAMDEAKVLSANILIDQIRLHGPYNRIREAGFKVFSQFDDDGIIQYLIHGIEINSETFVEFGVGDYTEANTRFLLVNNNWRGLVIDGSQENMDRVKKDRIYWQHDLTAVNAFVDRDNINGIIRGHGFSGETGLLSIDIDGNDYWMWECISAVSPVIVIVEYNSVFGSRHAVTIPYDPAFRRTTAHFSNLFWGCSLKALCLLAWKKGYLFVGSNTNGNNAYFVREDKINSLQPLTAEEGYVESRFRESRDLDGNLSYVSGERRIKIIEDMVVYDVEKDRVVRIRDL